jgi:hypothetical protein
MACVCANQTQLKFKVNANVTIILSIKIIHVCARSLSNLMGNFVCVNQTQLKFKVNANVTIILSIKIIIVFVHNHLNTYRRNANVLDL